MNLFLWKTIDLCNNMHQPILILFLDHCNFTQQWDQLLQELERHFIHVMFLEEENITGYFCFRILWTEINKIYYGQYMYFYFQNNIL